MQLALPWKHQMNSITKKIKTPFLFIKKLFSLFFTVFMFGNKYDEEEINSLEEHIKKVDPLKCQCNKCFMYYYLRAQKLEKENIELRDRWIRIFGNFNEKRKVIETYKTFSEKGIEVNDGYF